MTAKRFNLIIDSEWWIVKDDSIKSNKYRNDLDGDDAYRGLKEGELTEKEVVDLLNELYEENNLLKDTIKDIVVQLDANHTSQTYQMTIPINKVIYNELKRRLKETSFNEELRRFLE